MVKKQIYNLTIPYTLLCNAIIVLNSEIPWGYVETASQDRPEIRPNTNSKR